MKKIVAVILLILIFAAGAPFINGLLLEKTIRNVFEEANSMYAESGFDYSLEIIDYDRNILTSDIEWKINFGSLKAVYGIEEMIFTEHARHGYIKVVSNTSFEKNEWFQRFIENKLQGENPLTITTSYSLFGDIESVVRSEPFSITVENEVVDIHAGEFSIATDSDLKHFTSSGKWQGFNAAGQVSVGEVDVDSELEMISTFIWKGYLSFSTSDFVVKVAEEAFSYTRMDGKYILDHDRDANTLSAQTHVSMDGLKAGQHRIEKASAQFAVNNMSAQGYEDFMTAYTEIMSEVLENLAALKDDPGKAGEFVEEQMGTIGIQLIAAYEKLLKRDLELKISDLHVVLPQGDIKADITLRLLRDMTLMQFAPVIGQPDLALEIFYLNSDIKLPIEFVGEPPLLLSPSYPGMQTGLFVREGDILNHSAETRDNKLFLNGKEFDLSQP